MQIDAFINRASALLVDSESARLDAELLLAFVLDKPRSFFYAHPEAVIDTDKLSALWALVERRAEGIPLAYLTNTREFWSHTLLVNEHVLIPRPETEDMVEAVLQLPLPPNANVVDAGTGSGAIALALASEHTDWFVLAIEYCRDAAHVAWKNFNAANGAATEKNSNTPALICASWLSACAQSCLDLIVANPPYIASDDPHLQMGDVRFEPRSALVSNNGGYDDIRCIVKQACICLKPGGYLAIEHGYLQGKQVVDIFSQYGFTDVLNHNDLAGQSRFVIGRNAQAKFLNQ